MSGNKELADVLAFHKKFGQLAPSKITHLTLRKMEERIAFHQEEGVTELRRASEAQDMALMLDALVDAVYVIKGTAVMLGISPEMWDEAWSDVQRANMAKVRGMTQRGNLVDVCKPPGWVPPQTDAILEMNGYRPEEWFTSDNGTDDPHSNDEVRIRKELLLDDDVHLAKPVWTEVKGDAE